MKSVVLLVSALLAVAFASASAAASASASGASAAPATLTSGGLAITITPAGVYEITVDGKRWASGDSSSIPLRLGGGAAVNLTALGGLVASSGSDALGAYKKVELAYDQHPASGIRQLLASVRAYTTVRAYITAGRELLVFGQAWPGGFARNGAAAASDGVAIAPFPSFSTAGVGERVNFLEFGGCQVRCCCWWWWWW